MKSTKTVPFIIQVSPARARFLKSASAQLSTCPFGAMLEDLIDQCLSSDGECLELTSDCYTFDTDKEKEDAEHSILISRRQLIKSEKSLHQETA